MYTSSFWTLPTRLIHIIMSIHQSLRLKHTSRSPNLVAFAGATVIKKSLGKGSSFIPKVVLSKAQGCSVYIVVFIPLVVDDSGWFYKYTMFSNIDITQRRFENPMFCIFAESTEQWSQPKLQESASPSVTRGAPCKIGLEFLIAGNGAVWFSRCYVACLSSRVLAMPMGQTKTLKEAWSNRPRKFLNEFWEL